MNLDIGREERSMRHTKRLKESPWKRGRDEIMLNRARGVYIDATMNTMDEKFNDYKYVNMDLDITTKRAALRASASVVGLVSRAGGETLFKSSGLIYESSSNADGTFKNGILTSASLIGSSEHADIKIEVYIHGGRMFDGHLFGYDPHYNLAILYIVSEAPLAIATFRLLDDSVSIDPALVHTGDRFELRPHSSRFKLCAGEVVVALGRNCEDSKIMVAPGKFSLDDCKYDCIELMMATCRITKPGIGGPLVNRYGEVIGVNFMNNNFTPFLPVNIFSKVLNYFKKHGQFCRPWIGVGVTNLYAIEVAELEHIVYEHPNISKGVFVEAVFIDSPADRAGILCKDVIVECNGKPVRGFLKFFRKILGKGGKSVEVGVIREGNNGLLKLDVAVEEFTADRFNSWPLPREFSLRIDTYRDI